MHIKMLFNALPKFGRNCFGLIMLLTNTCQNIQFSTNNFRSSTVTLLSKHQVLKPVMNVFATSWEVYSTSIFFIFQI